MSASKIKPPSQTFQKYQTYNDTFLDQFLVKATFKLRSITQYYFQTLDTPGFQEYVTNLKAFTDSIREQLLTVAAGPTRARLMHTLINRDIEALTNTKTTCHKGCGSCCYFEVEVTTEEASRLAELILGGLEINHSHLELQAGRISRSSKWESGITDTNRCVFLGDDEACRVYEARPSACRKHMVTSPPSECKTITGKPTIVLLPFTEAIISASLNLLSEPLTSLSKGVADALIGLEEKATADRESIAATIPIDLLAFQDEAAIGLNGHPKPLKN